MATLATELDTELDEAQREAGAFMDYLREADLIDLLSPTQELQLGRRIRRGRTRQGYVTNQGRYKVKYVLSSDALAARNTMVEANLLLSVHFAKRIITTRKNVLPLEDLVAEGNFGLLEAATTFDPDKRLRFSTWGAWWVRRDIHRAISANQSWGRAPEHVALRIAKVARYMSDYEALHGALPELADVAQALGYTLSDVVEAYDLDHAPYSLNNNVKRTAKWNSKGTQETFHYEYADTLKSDTAPTMRNIPTEDRNRIARAIKANPNPDQRLVLAGLLGYTKDGSYWEIAEIAASLGRSEQFVRRAKTLGFAHLKATLARQGVFLR